MTRELFTDGWTVRSHGAAGPAVPISLPHDAMISEPRSASAPSGFHGAFFPGGRYVYEKTWSVAADAPAHVSLLFEGIYGEATIRLNGHVVASSISPYREFRVSLDEPLLRGQINVIEVEVDNLTVPSSRWYTGSGIYRPVWIELTPVCHLVPDGARVHVSSLDQEAAIVEIEADITNPEGIPVELHVQIGDGIALIAEETAHSNRLRISIPNARPWSAEDPFLYRAVVSLRHMGAVVDAIEMRIGVRILDLDASRGMRINGEEVLLRGTALHHDSGILGAATHRAAEFRRARILKECGFNAVRSAHNPLSRDMLDACDEVGLYVVDELADYWHESKSEFDLASRFDDLWAEDVRSLVAKDRNHPSVIMYSIGNEIGETATLRGVDTSRRLDAAFSLLDPHRPTTLAVSFLVNVMVQLGKPFAANRAHDEEVAEAKKPSKISSTFANEIANRLGGIMNVVARTSAADRASRDAFATVAAAGYNYGWSRYAGDVKRYPGRIMYGSESIAGDILKIWPLVERHPSILGDFMWIGWDYLGEAGIGTWRYGDDIAPVSFPLLTGGAGAIDITGMPGAQLLLAHAVWGLLDTPKIAVRPLDQANKKVHRAAWRHTDAIESWAWSGAEGTAAEIEVYSVDPLVELFLNGRSLGRKPAGVRKGYLARFRVPYEPGEIVAVGHAGDGKTARGSLRSAGPARLAVHSEAVSIVADGQDLAFLRIVISDADGVVEMLADDTVSVAVSGPAELIGLGSGAPSSTESFADDSHRTHYGRALAVVRSTGEAGQIIVNVSSLRHGQASVVIAAESASRPNEPLGLKSINQVTER